jgi:carboxyl-terminal processing protease
VQAALDALRVARTAATILDLRGNSGGLLQAAIDVAELFLPERTLVVYTEGRTRNQNMRFVARAKRPDVDVPLAVLVDEGTSAGAEIVASALQDWKRATLVGMKTSGRASIQTIVPLSDRSVLKLTTAQWFTPKGRSVHRRGLVPDIEVALPAGDDRFLMDPTRDTQLRLAMTIIRGARAR